MRRVSIFLVLAASAALLLAFRSVPTTATEVSSIQGVWKAVSWVRTNAEGTEEGQVTQPNLTIFTTGHYAGGTVRGSEPREVLPEDATDEQRLAAWRRYGGGAGTYRLEGNTLSTKVIVAKSPNATAEQRENTSMVEVDGDTLRRTWTNAENNSSWTTTYTRVE